MWTYRIVSGGLYPPSEYLATNPKALAFGYSGAAGTPQNNPEYCPIHDTGPIPPGMYTIGEPVDTVTHGPFVLPLTPDASNEMFGRSGFLLHGDSKTHPGAASKGCIIMPRAVREQVNAIGPRRLSVR